MLSIDRNERRKSKHPAQRRKSGAGGTAEPARRATEDKVFDHLAQHVDYAEDRQEALIDEGLEESFPASDPLSPKHIT